MSKARNRAVAAYVAFSAALATWLTMFAWVGFTEEPARYLAPTSLIAALVAVTGVIARHRGASGLLVVGAQAGLVVAAVFVLVSGHLIPDRNGLAALADAFADATTAARLYTSPIPAEAPGVHPLLIAGGAVCLLLVDLLAATWRRVALSGVPLVGIYLLPIGMNGTPVATWVFVASASAYLLVLFLNQSRLIGRWGQPLDEAEPGEATPGPAMTPPPATARAAGQAAGIAALAILFGLASTIATPSWNVSGWGFGPGSGPGSDELTIESPMADLRRDLIRGDDIAMLSLRTDDPSPDYLRIAVLNRFSSNAWTSGDRNFPNEQTARGQELTLTGVRPELERRDFAYTIRTAERFDSSWLPTPFPSTQVNAKGLWKYDENTMDFFAADEDLDAADLTYTATGVDLSLDARALARAPSGAGAVASMYTSLPSSLPDVVNTLATSVTEAAPSKFEKAVALQRWFRDANNFSYSLETVPGTGTDALVAFLTPGNGGRVGYCEQFASAMAVMARTLDIPARVAVGFLSPDRVSDGVWQYSAWDLHAWPELYFPGSGWVKFEPTPSGRAPEVPEYTSQNLPAPAPAPSVAPDPSQAAPSDGAPRSGGPRLPDEPVATSSTESSAWPVVAGALGVAVAIGALLLVPRLVRSARRRRRWQDALADGLAAEAAWAELQDTVIDLRRRWPSGLSPDGTRQRLIPWLQSAQPGRRRDGHHQVGGQDRTAEQALDRIVLVVEESRYAAEPGQLELASLRADVERCAAALAAGVTPRARRLGRWWPSSALRRARRWQGEQLAGDSLASGLTTQADEEVLDRIG